MTFAIHRDLGLRICERSTRHEREEYDRDQFLHFCRLDTAIPQCLAKVVAMRQARTWLNLVAKRARLLPTCNMLCGEVGARILAASGPRVLRYLARSLPVSAQLCGVSSCTSVSQASITLRWGSRRREVHLKGVPRLLNHAYATGPRHHRTPAVTPERWSPHFSRGRGVGACG